MTVRFDEQLHHLQSIKCPYCLIVCESLRAEAVEIACNGGRACSGVFIHHCCALGQWMVAEGIEVDELRKDKNLTMIWPATV